MKEYGEGKGVDGVLDSSRYAKGFGRCATRVFWGESMGRDYQVGLGCCGDGWVM